MRWYRFTVIVTLSTGLLADLAPASEVAAAEPLGANPDINTYLDAQARKSEILDDADCMAGLVCALRSGEDCGSPC